LTPEAIDGSKSQFRQNPNQDFRSDIIYLTYRSLH
jgi:hypothetical protein